MSRQFATTQMSLSGRRKRSRCAFQDHHVFTNRGEIRKCRAASRLSISDGRICLTNNAAERALRGFALGRKAWLFAGSERGADRAAFMATLIMTAKLNGVDPQAWLADVLTRIAETPVSRVEELLPWNWKPTGHARQAA